MTRRTVDEEEVPIYFTVSVVEVKPCEVYENRYGSKLQGQ
jgi:hypothetical protein